MKYFQFLPPSRSEAMFEICPRVLIATLPSTHSLSGCQACPVTDLLESTCDPMVRFLLPILTFFAMRTSVGEPTLWIQYITSELNFALVLENSFPPRQRHKKADKVVQRSTVALLVPLDPG